MMDELLQGNRHQLICGLVRLAADYTEQQLELLLAYQRLLIKWNKAYNLISTRDQHQIITRHILDSLSLYPYLKSFPAHTSSLDFGTGAGFPGLPLAIMQTTMSFTLLDSSRKKIAFLQQCRIQLPLANIRPQCQRIEAHHIQYPLIVTRAVQPLRKLIPLTVGHLTHGGSMLVMLGAAPSAEDMRWTAAHVRTLSLEKSDASYSGDEDGQIQRHILMVTV